MRTTTKKISTVAVGLFLAVTIGILSTIPGVPTPAEARMPTQEQGTESTSIDPGAGTGYIGPHLWGVLQAQANDKGVPPRITIKIGTWPNVKVEVGLGKFIRSVGGKKVSDDTWDVPTAKALEIIQRPDVHDAVLIRDGVSGAVSVPANLDSVLGDIVEAYSNNVTASSAAQYAMFARSDSVVVAVKAPNAVTIASVRAWLKKKDVYALPASETEGAAPEHLAVLLPVKYITALAKAYSTTRFEVAHYKGQGLTLSRTYWPQETKDLEDTIINQYVEGATATALPTTHNTPKDWEVDLADKLKLHGVDRWHAMGYTGDDVKVGIIDWTFTDWNKAAKVTSLPKMVKGAEKGVANANAYCQPITRSTVPDSVILLSASHTCEPTAFGGVKVTHGVKVGQLILDMAPDATLYLAQANSPRQMYNAAAWLNSQGVAVIVHAGGWPYDSGGDGTAHFNLTHYNDSTLLDINEDSPMRYYPSPLYTVDTTTGSSNGPVWVNAAGNAEEWTLNLKKPSLVNDGDSDYHRYVIFQSGKKKHKDQTCQKLPITIGNVYYFSMRWADSWPNGKFDLEYEMQRQFLGFGRDLLVNTELREQHTTGAINYPVRKSSVLSWKGYDVCLRIKVTTPDDETPVAPAWIQFQGLVGKNAFEKAPNWPTADLDGHSIVNPAESASQSLVAVGARNMRETTTEVTDYSSRGPVFAKGGDIINTSPGRIKPDLVAGSHTATYINWLKDCRQALLRSCGDGIYLKGTTAATGHTGGLAAVLIGYYDELGLPLTATATANLLRLLAVDEGTTGTGWGQGFLELPCPPKKVSLPYTSSGAKWEATDCESEASSGRSDYYVFTVPTRRQVTIDLNSTTHAHLRLARGAHSRQSAFATKTNGALGGSAQIKQSLAAGTYTLEVATDSGTATGTYTVKISNQSPEGTLAPDPASFDFKPDGTWHAFTVSANVPVKIIANPGSTDERMEINASKPGRTYCPAEQDDDVRRTNGQTVYLAACTAGSGTIEVRNANDNSLLTRYVTTVKAPAVTPRASLSPRPSSLKGDGKWQAFTVSSNVDVEVEVNPTGTTPRIELTNSSTAGNHCANGADVGDDVDASNGDTIYLAGCTAGTGTVRLLRESDGKVITAYAVTITAMVVPQVCKPVTDFKAVRIGNNAVKASWTNPSDGKTATARVVQVRVWNTANSAWQNEQNINEPASATSSWHIGAFSDKYYSYRVWSKCGTTYSLSSGWRTIAPVPSDSAQGQSGDEIPTPTPRPNQSDEGSPDDGEKPPTPN